MRAATHLLARLALAPLLLAACATDQATPPEAAAGPVPVALRLTLAGDAVPIIGPDGTGRLELVREGSDEPSGFTFESGVLAVHDLEPGDYEIAKLGPLDCRGLAFQVGATPRHLGSVGAELVRSRYHVALMSRAAAAPNDTAALAAHAGTAVEAVDARPLEVSETAPCFLGPDGPVTTWADLTLGEKVILGTGVAALCALALTAGGFCSF